MCAAASHDTFVYVCSSSSFNFSEVSEAPNIHLRCLGHRGRSLCVAGLERTGSSAREAGLMLVARL